MAVPIAVPVEAAAEPEWSLPRRLGFRFAFLYVVLFAAPFPLYQDALTTWLGARLADPIVARFDAAVTALSHLLFGPNAGAGLAPLTGDTPFEWSALLVRLLLAVVGTAVWSALARRARSHRFAAGALVIYLRYFLAAMMFSYGSVKLLPVQFGHLRGEHLVMPVGELDPMGMLWMFMRASSGYTIFSGAVEVLGGVLLLFRRTTTLGALVVAGAMANVVALNVFYDVVVKLGSSHYLLFAVALVALDARRLVDVFLRGRAVEPVSLAPRTRATRIAKAVLIVLMVGTNAASAGELVDVVDATGPIDGAWSVQGDPSISRIGISAQRARLVYTDARSSEALRARFDGASTVVLTHRGGADETLTWKALDGGRVELTGTLDGKPATLVLTPIASPLVSSPIHWVQR